LKLEVLTPTSKVSPKEPSRNTLLELLLRHCSHVYHPAQAYVTLHQEEYQASPVQAAAAGAQGDTYALSADGYSPGMRNSPHLN
jgi:hypothetical protein